MLDRMVPLTIGCSPCSGVLCLLWTLQLIILEWGDQPGAGLFQIIACVAGGIEARNSRPMPRDVTIKQLVIVTAVCAFSLTMAQVKAEDRFSR